MKKTYETPILQTILTANEDVLTTSVYTEFDKVDGVGAFDTVIEWGK